MAAELESIASEARARGSPSASAHALEAAANLTADADEQGRRFVEAARARLEVGQFERAIVALDHAEAASVDPALRLQIAHTRGRVGVFHGSIERARELLAATAAEIEERDPARAVELYTEIFVTHLIAGQSPAALASVRCMQVLAQRAFAGDYEGPHELLTGLVARLRGRSAVGELPYALAALCLVEFRRGRTAVSYAAGAESVALAGATGQNGGMANGMAWLARVEAVMGREAECREHLATAREICSMTGGNSILAGCAAFLGLLELGAGRTDEAIDLLETARNLEVDSGLGEPAVLQSAPDLIEAYARAGRHEDGVSALRLLESQAEQTRGLWAAGAAARCRGLLGTDAEVDGYFSDALSSHARAGEPFEQARTELAYGERLRRARRRTDARPHVRSALATFERLGATPWAERARHELAATGEHARQRRVTTAEQLTAQELHFALLVSEGATNREAAAALFVSPRTIDAHLGHICRKLGLRSRAELARLGARRA